VVLGADFSTGMLQQAKRKIKKEPNIFLIQANVANLPFKENVFDAVTCSHAFYELEGETSVKCLQEVVRVLDERKRFVMMEHDVPRNFLVRVLFYIRIFSLGRSKALQVLQNEEQVFKHYFRSVDRISSKTGRSKIFVGYAGGGTQTESSGCIETTRRTFRQPRDS
jgi:demethylmenaquinone methyltransferase/2-methoxy-6-polyprenyl-1,4-benzoquinol methylase